MRGIALGIVVAVIGIAVAIAIYKRREGFAEPPRILTSEETARFLLEDSDGYIAGLSAVDLYARKSRTSAEYAQKAAAAACDLSAYAQKINAAVRLAGHGVPPGVKIAGTSGRFYEDGLPHTRRDIIFITPEIASGSLERLSETLVHESVHLYQRENPKEIAEWLRRAGYSRVGARTDYPLARANPDLDGWIYADAKGKVYIAEYNSERPSSIRDVQLSDPAFEHPFENMAYFIAAGSKQLGE